MINRHTLVSKEPGPVQRGLDRLGNEAVGFELHLAPDPSCRQAHQVVAGELGEFG